LTSKPYVDWVNISCVSVVNACDAIIAFLFDLYVPEVEVIKLDIFYACSWYGRYRNDSVVCCTNDKLPDWNNIVTLHYMEPSSNREFHKFIHYVPNTEINYKWTFVTCFFGENMQYLSPILELPINLVIYGDEKSLEQIRETDNIKLITYDITKSPYYYGNNYLSRAKFDMLKLAIDNAYFENDDSEHFYGWIDNDLTESTTKHIQHQIEKIMAVYRKLCSFAMINYTNRKVLNIEKSNYPDISCKFFTGNKSNLLKLCDLFHQKSTTLQDKDYTDENILPLIYDDNKNLFEFYYGHRFASLINYDHIHVSPGSIIDSLLVSSRYHCAWNICNTAATKLLQDYDDKFLFKFIDATSRYVNIEDDFEEHMNVRMERIINNGDIIWPSVSSEAISYAKIKFETSTNIDDIIKHPIVIFLSQYHNLLIFANVPLSHHSFCTNKIIVRPSSMENKITIPDEKLKVTVTLK
jgi:hypothetical protein